MKEELIRVLTAKLDDINKNINLLTELNNKIDDENEKLAYAQRVLENFKEDGEYNILNFVKLTKDDFIKVLGIVDNDSDKLFSSNGCNYDGLVYLINGIKNGVSLNLTEEQKSGIEYLIRGVGQKEEEYKTVIDSLILDKNRFAINDINVLNQLKEEYNSIIKKINNKEYVDETDKICEAINYCGLNSESTIGILSYVLEYNSDLYKNGKITYKLPAQNELSFNHQEEIKDNTNDNVESSPVETQEELTSNTMVEEESLHNISFENNSLGVDNQSFENEVTDTLSFENNTNDNISFETSDNEIKEPNLSNDVDIDNNISFEEETPSELPEDVVPLSFDNNENKEDTVQFTSYDVQEEKPSEISFEPAEVTDELTTNNQVFPPLVEEPKEENYHFDNQEENENLEVEPVDNGFANVGITQEDYSVEEEKTSTRELQRLFEEYELKNTLINDDLLDGNANNYRKVLETLKNNNILGTFGDNEELLREVLISSGEEEINEVLRIIKNDLSVDEDDYRITVNITINTIPTIFIKDGGNYDNFIKNVKLFKELGINLVNLFDFSKEVFIVDNLTIENNYSIVKKYNVGIDYKNAKYLLVLPNIAERMDYYVESTYEDKTKNNEKFDGITYINNYAVKLNTVSDLTIKRLRYSSESGKKVFGSKPNSLSGEITNLKVSALDISKEYLDKFFNNEFDGLTSEEVREYIKLIRNSSNVGNYEDELENLEEYHNGLRYTIKGINISYNKVLRNYNILRSYGINNSKALHFALCYNLVITKDEYQELKRFINDLGGNA